MLDYKVLTLMSNVASRTFKKIPFVEKMVQDIAPNRRVGRVAVTTSVIVRRRRNDSEAVKKKHEGFLNLI